MLHRFVNFLVIPALLLLGACQDYDFKVNDKVVYSPTLFRNFTTPDAGLTGCLQQTIKDTAVTAGDQLTVLDCSSAGIESLEGLATFTGLKTLRLSANQIRNLVELNKISTLEALYLDDNKIIDPVPLYQLHGLRHVDLSGNDSLQCPKPGSFKHVATVILPQHCR